MGERSFGARWWRESLGIGRLARRPAIGTMGLCAALALPACATTWAGQDGAGYSDSRDDIAVNVDSLALQRNEGWDVGQGGAPLAFVGSTDLDAAGTQSWRDAMPNLAGALAPTAPALQPYYVPTLFQSLIGPAGQRLRAVMRPMHTAEMDEDLARGIALRVQFGTVGWPKDTAIVIDAHGPRAVAVAAALADRFAPIFTFGNWPHPAGVVPAHQTIAASLYYLPMFTAAAAVRAPDAPPMFVLDANRLAPYSDAASQFDNRYFVKLPSAAELQALGVRHVMYVGADGGRELDDLNGALVALCQNGVDVKMLALSDFVRAGDEPQLAVNDDPDAADDGDPGDDEAEAAVDPSWAWMFMWSRPAWLWSHYWYRGCWWDWPFWRDYGWYPCPHGVPHVPRGRGAIVVGPPPGHRALPLPTRAGWTPAARNTMFKPSVGVRAANQAFGQNAALGQMVVRASRFDGHITGMGTSYGNGTFGARAGGGGAGHIWPSAHTTFRSSVGGFGGSHTVFGGSHTVFGGGRSGSVGRAGNGSFGGG